jgi:hypothetical protein
VIYYHNYNRKAFYGIESIGGLVVRNAGRTVYKTVEKALENLSEGHSVFMFEDEDEKILWSNDDNEIGELKEPVVLLEEVKLNENN